MSVVSAVLLFLVLFERCQSSFAVKHVAKNQESFQDIQINNVKNKLITTRVECILECVTMVTCMSVLYHTTTRTCYRLSIGYTTSPTDVGFHDIGWRYYIILEENCERHDGYVYSQEFRSCYKLHEYNSSLEIVQYNQVCNTENGELMRIDSETKLQHVTKFLGQFRSFPTDFIAIQGRHHVSEFHWYYNDGTPITFFKWAPTQPDASTLNTYESLALSVNDGFLMHDLWKEFKGPFLCEKRV